MTAPVCFIPASVPKVCTCVLVSPCSVLVCAAARPYQPSTRVVSHFELLLSDSYRLDVCVVAEASEQHFALCIPQKVTPEQLRRIQPGDSMS